MNAQALELAAWETTGTEMTHPPMHVQAGGRVFSTQLIGQYLRFCEPASPRVRSEPSRWNFAVRERVSVSHGTFVNPVYLQNLFENEWQRGHIGRLVFLGADALFFGRDGEGLVSSADWRSFGNHRDAPRIPFAFRFDGDFDLLPATFWRDLATTLDADETSDLHFARSLVNAEGNALARLTCDFPHDWDEMERGAHLLLLCDPEWRSPLYADCAPTVGVRVELRRGFAPRLHLVCDEWSGFAEEGDYERARHEPGPLWNVWLAHFVRGFDEELLSRHLAGESVRECDFVLSIERRDQTAHEQVEVLLKLRDWLEGKLPPDEIARLLAGLTGRNSPQ